MVLGNSTTYGLHLLANGLPLQAGDEIVLVEGDFPATITPWLPLVRRGITVRRILPATRPLRAEQLAAELTRRSRVFCSSWVFSFSGEAIDVDELGSLCRDRGVLFVLNGSQAIGTRPLDLSASPVDALVSCGFKWLCGPYATGFCWLQPDLAERLAYTQAYWLTQLTSSDLSREDEATLRDDLGAARFDVFCTANFLNFQPWLAAVELLLDVGIEQIAAHNQRLVERLLDGLEHSDWTVVSPRAGPHRSTLVHLRHPQAGATTAAHHALRQAGIDVALRAENLRLAPHLHNTTDDIDRALDVLTST